MPRKIRFAQGLLLIGIICVSFLDDTPFGTWGDIWISLAVRSPATMATAMFLLVTTLVLLGGMSVGVAQQDLFGTHWTRDSELLHWTQRTVDVERQDVFGTTACVYGDAMLLIGLAAPLYLLMAGPGRQGYLWLGLAAALPAARLGMQLGNLYRRRSSPNSVTLLDTGLIYCANFFPWDHFSWFDAQSDSSVVRLYAQTGLQPILLSLRPPRELIGTVVNVLEKHLATRRSDVPLPDPKALAAWLSAETVLFVVGCALAVGVCLLPDHNLACILFVAGYWAWDRGFHYVVCRAAGIHPVRAGTGLERVEA